MPHQTSAALLVLVAAALAVGLLAAPAAASHGDENTNFTVLPENREPGATEVTYRLELNWTGPASGNAGMENIDRVEFAVQNTNLEGCGSGGLFGSPYSLSVDDGSGTEELSVAGSDWSGNAVAFAVEDTPRFRVGHTLILELDSCVQTGDNENWFQGVSVVQGPAITEGQNVTIEGVSHYFGICDGCSSDDDARAAMGSPPSEPEPTPAPTATATPEPTATATQTPSSVTTATATATATPTPEPTATPEPTDTTDADGQGGGFGQPGDADVLGMDPLAVVGIVAIVSVGLAALGARRL